MVGRRVKWLRKLREISQDELGRLVGLGQTAISRIEMGLRDLSFDEAKRMARALGCSLDDRDGSDGASPEAWSATTLGRVGPYQRHGRPPLEAWSALTRGMVGLH